MITSSGDSALIEKKILYAGTNLVDFKDGTKVHFHFQTRICNEQKILLDDSKKMGTGKPMELVLGKKFKLEVWEVIVQKMALNEVAAFTVDKSLVAQYPFVSKTLRDSYKSVKERNSHCCAMTLQTKGIGYLDLNELLNNPCNLEFIIELLKVEQPEDYEKESWQLSESEKLNSLPNLRELGNEEFKKKNYEKAADFYAKAIGILEQLMLKEKPHDKEWNELTEQRIPFLLNYSQCKLLLGDYYAVIKHCTTILETDSNNVKAYFRRAKAHVGAWNPTEAIEDFNKVILLDSSLTYTVKKELNVLNEMIKNKDYEDRGKFKKLF